MSSKSAPFRWKLPSKMAAMAALLRTELLPNDEICNRTATGSRPFTAYPIHIVPTGLSGVSPPGPAIPETAMVMSVPESSRRLRAIPTTV